MLIDVRYVFHITYDWSLLLPIVDESLLMFYDTLFMTYQVTFAINHLGLITSYRLRTTYCLFLIPCYSLLITHYLIVVTHHDLRIMYYLLLGTYCVLRIKYCLFCISYYV